MTKEKEYIIGQTQKFESMKTEYEYLIFKQAPVKPNWTTTQWYCLNKKSSILLGLIKWESSWRQYCYYPQCDAVYSAGCLNDISDFIKQLMNDRKK